MKDRVFWKVIAVGVVLGLFAVAYGLCRNSQLPSFSSSAYAAEATNNTKLPLTFERLDNEISRAKVEGGWLVKASARSSIVIATTGGANAVGGGGDVKSVSITFYPDPQHLWNGGGMK